MLPAVTERPKNIRQRAVVRTRQAQRQTAIGNLRYIRLRESDAAGGDVDAANNRVTRWAGVSDGADRHYAADLLGNGRVSLHLSAQRVGTPFRQTGKVKSPRHADQNYAARSRSYFRDGQRNVGICAEPKSVRILLVFLCVAPIGKCRFVVVLQQESKRMSSRCERYAVRAFSLTKVRGVCRRAINRCVRSPLCSSQRDEFRRTRPDRCRHRGNDSSPLRITICCAVGRLCRRHGSTTRHPVHLVRRAVDDDRIAADGGASAEAP